MSNLMTFLMVLIAVPYIALPLMLWRTQRFGKFPGLRAATSHYLPERILKTFTEMGDPLLAQGFTYCFDATTSDYMPNVKFYTRMYVNSQSKVMAIVFVIAPEDTAVQFEKSYLEFVTKFEDNTEMCTHNSDITGAPIEPKNRTVRALYNVVEPVALYNVHSFFLNRAGKQAVLPEPGLEMEALQRSMAADLVFQESVGGLTLDEALDSYRPTLAGAVLMAWYSMWPISFFRRIFKQAKAKIWLRQSNLERKHA